METPTAPQMPHTLRTGELFPIKGMWCRFVGIDRKNNWIVMEPVSPTAATRKARLKGQGR